MGNRTKTCISCTELWVFGLCHNGAYAHPEVHAGSVWPIRTSLLGSVLAQDKLVRILDWSFLFGPHLSVRAEGPLNTLP